MRLHLVITNIRDLYARLHFFGGDGIIGEEL